MFYAFLIFIVVAAFFLGYRLGMNSEPKVKSKTYKADSEALELRKEYENFLNYDGDEQL